ncbi:MAG TPA: NAD(P)/FAD-dependent oxidoreductase, partial [Methylophaga sp.]|nr:NAD(P)/FAD-dependent oxidoreductase [Methylophaga sp.]
MSNKQTLVVIGNGMVGQNFLVSLMASDIEDNYDVVTFCEEAIPAYDRVHLSEYFAGKSAAELSLVEEGFFENNNITIHLSDKATMIDRENKTVTSEKGKVIAYDKLVLATGSNAFIPPIPGNDRENCIAYRTIDDLDDMKEAAKISKVGAVVGGGLLGLEAAKALQDLDLITHVVQFGPRLMSAQLDDG